MALTVIIFLVALPVLFVLYDLYRRKRYSSLPPGPTPWPLLGNLMEFWDSCPQYEKLAKLSQRYGDIMTFWFPTKPVVILSSAEAVRTAYIERPHEFADRPDKLMSVMFFGDFDQDVAFGRYTPRWQAKRRLVQQSIRLYYILVMTSPFPWWQYQRVLFFRHLVGTERLEKETISVAEQVIDKILQEGTNVPIDLRQYMLKAVYNMVMILAFGKRFDLDDPEFVRFHEFHNLDIDAIGATLLYDMFPFLGTWPLLVSPTLRKMKGAVQLYRSYLSRWLSETEPAIGKAEYMTQALLKGLSAVESKESMKDKESGLLEKEPFTDQEIMAMLFNLYLGSTSTTTTTITWLFLELILHPEIQEKCYQQLTEVVGNRHASLSDRHQLPYVEACILEALRFHTPMYFSMPHTPSVDATLGDYKIPAGTETLLNIWAVHHDPKVWKDAYNFNPDNFLDNDGQLFRPPQLMPFGAGRRVCVGESFAKNGVFLLLTVLLQQLRFEQVPGYEYGTDTSNIEFMHVAKPYVVSVSKRQ